jgi:hypothetical protein
MKTNGFCWDVDGNKRNLRGTIWELDGKSSPHPFKMIRNIRCGPCVHTFKMEHACGFS